MIYCSDYNKYSWRFHLRVILEKQGNLAQTNVKQMAFLWWVTILLRPEWNQNAVGTKWGHNTICYIWQPRVEEPEN